MPHSPRVVTPGVTKGPLTRATELARQERAALNRKPLPRVRDRLLPAAEQIALFYRQCFALLDVYESQEILLTLQEAARLKILQKARQLRRSLYELPGPRRPPP